MPPFLFWLFVVIMLGFGCAVVANRNPVASALSLVVSFMALAALFVGLEAYFIAVIQVLVYGGAVMVLFLFIIMLLDLKAEERRKLNIGTIIGGAVVTAIFGAQLVGVLNAFPEGRNPFPVIEGNFDDVRNVGHALFAGYNLPFQVIGTLVLVATIGVVVLSKKELK